MSETFGLAVQSAINSPTTPQTLALTGVTTGDQLEVHIALQSGDTASISDDKGNTYTSRLSAVNFGGADAYVWTCASAAASGTTTLSVVLGGGPSFVNIWFKRSTGGDPFDTLVSNHETSGTTRTSGIAATSNSGLINGQIFVDSGSSAVAVGAGYTLDLNGGFSGNALAEHKSYSGNNAATFTNVDTAQSTLSIAVLWKDGAAASGASLAWIRA